VPFILDRLEYAIPGIKITYQGILAGRKGAKMYKVEVTLLFKCFIDRESMYERRSGGKT
jgi:hypothetical protein